MFGTLCYWRKANLRMMTAPWLSDSRYNFGKYIRENAHVLIEDAQLAASFSLLAAITNNGTDSSYNIVREVRPGRREQRITKD